MARSRIVYDDRELAKKLKNFPRQVDRALTAVMSFESARAQAYARQNAPWNDQTGNARSGLFTKTFREPFKSYGFDVSHAVPYGIWLEVRFSGKNAIIGPTVEARGPEVMQTISTLFSRMT